MIFHFSCALDRYSLASLTISRTLQSNLRQNLRPEQRRLHVLFPISRVSAQYLDNPETSTMSTHEEEEEVISSPLSSVHSSIFELDDFDFASPPPERAPGPTLADSLPPFHQETEPVVDSSPPSSRGSTSKTLLDAFKDKKRPVKKTDEDPVSESINTRTQDTAQDETAADHSHIETTAHNAQDEPTTEQIPATPTSPEPATAGSPTNDKKRKAASTTSTAKKKVVMKRARKNDPKRWQLPYVFTDPKSPLVTAPLRVYNLLTPRLVHFS